MGYIAEYLQISKKTLYAEFDNKEEVLLECFNYERGRITKIIKKNDEEATNPLEALAMNLSGMYHHSFSMCPAFSRDLRHFSKVMNVVLVYKAQLHDALVSRFNRCVTEGYFQPSSKFDPIASLCIEMLSSSINTQQPQGILIFLRGMCTSKGIEVLNTFTVTKMN